MGVFSYAAPARWPSLSCAEGPLRARSVIDQALADRVAGQLDAVAYAEFLVDVRAVGVDRLGA